MTEEKDNTIPNNDNINAKCSSRSPKLKKKRFINTNKLSKEQLQLALKKKKECNAKAQNIVKELLDPIEDQNSFIEKLQQIQQSHYNDIVIERAITKICGYPICSEKLTEIPKKQYHISTTTNKIYDITERKNFCSNNCFKKSSYLKDQLLSSPLWLRDQEDLPEFKLLSLE